MSENAEKVNPLKYGDRNGIEPIFSVFYFNVPFVID
jgi:hypothetical protein